MLDSGEGRYQYLPAHVPTFFLACELIFEMYAGRAGFEHCLRQFENIERSTETGFAVGYDGREPVDIGVTFGVVNLIGAL